MQEYKKTENPKTNDNNVTLNVPNGLDTLLKIKMSNKIKLYGTDAGSHSKRDLAVYVPDVGKDEYWIGQYGIENLNLINVMLPIITFSAPGLVLPPRGWEQIWNDHGSGNRNNYSCWKPIPYSGYRACGHFMRLNTSDTSPPNESEVQNFVCVHESLCDEVIIQNYTIWDDAGTHAYQDLTLWKVGFNEYQVDAKTFYGTNTRDFNQFNNRNPNIYAIKKDKMIKIE